MNEPHGFLYGAQYYRKPNPPRGEHRFHLTKIKKELGFNVIRIWVMWNCVEPKPGQYDLDEVDEILGLCDELGLQVVVQLVLEDAPYWLERKHPETRYINARGVPQELSGNDNHPAGGHPGLCLDNDSVAEPAAKFLKAAVSLARRHGSVIGYDCWNEPHIEPNWNSDYWATSADLLFCYCPASSEHFRKWLRERYETLERLNEAWARSFGYWEDVNPPRRHGNFADWLDWYRFWFDNLEAQQRWRYEVIRAADPGRFCMSHSGGVPPMLARIEAGINNFSLAKPVDMWGTSMAPLGQNWTTAEAAGCCEVTRSAANGKTWWISEMQAGMAHYAGLRKAALPEPRHIRSTNWIAAAYGAKAIVYWCYLSERTGNEAPGYGLIRTNGETTPRAAEAARTWQLMQRVEPLIMQHTPPSDVAIMYNPDSSTMLFAQDGHDRWVSYSHMAYYRAVWDEDCYARWVPPEGLHDIPERLLIIPMHYLLSEESAKTIRDYVADGGTVIAETNFGLFSPNGMQHPQVPPYGLAEVFGLEEEEGYRTWPDYQAPVNQPFGGPWRGEEYQAPEIVVSEPVQASFRAYGYLTPLRLTTARPIGEWDGRTFVAHNQYGKGEAFFFGTYAGLSMFHGETGTSELVRAIIHGCCTPQIRSSRLRPRLIEGENEALVCVFNNSRGEAFEESIQIPPRFRNATDLYSDETLKINDGAITLNVEPEDVALIHLTE
jgi:beta-galactosidase GanA